MIVPHGEIVVQMIRPFYVDGHAAVAPPNQIEKLLQYGDDPDEADDVSSTIEIYEDGHPIGPGHSSYADIRAYGAGRYSHWKGRGIAFSTSDNSDPNSNGRKYFAVKPNHQ